MLQEFIATHRQALIERTRARVALRAAPHASDDELAHGVPMFLTRLSQVLESGDGRTASDGGARINDNRHGSDLLQHGFTIAQVVLDYGDICQAITAHAVELGAPISVEEFQTLNQCLDSAIADAVTGYVRQRDLDVRGAEAVRHGSFAHEVRNKVSAALLALELLKAGRVGLSGSTMGVLERSLRSLRELVDRSMSEARLSAGVLRRQRLRLAELIEEMEVEASIDAGRRGLELTVERPDSEVFVDVDRHLFTCALSNLVQNALKFTRPGSHVWLRTRTAGGRVRIEVEDECGGLRATQYDSMFRAFSPGESPQSGTGLGLAISHQATVANGGSLSVHNYPGRGCVFVIELPLAGEAQPNGSRVAGLSAA